MPRMVTKQKTVRLDEDMYEGLKVLSGNSGVPIAELVRRAIRQAIPELPSVQAKPLPGQYALPGVGVESIPPGE